MFWVFMLIIDLLLPLSMLGFGILFTKHPPEEVNDFFGYRTNRSTKNRDTWMFAHKYCGKLWSLFGLIMLPITILAMVLIVGKSNDYNKIGMVGGIICLIQIIPMICSIFFVESALKKNFDNKGNRR